MAFATPEEIIEEIKNGRMVIMMDDEDRENEGDLIMAACHIDANAINFMLEYGKGLICLTLTQNKANQLDLKPMVQKNQSPFATNFTTSIEAATGVTTGISAQDRARTIQVATNPNACATDLVQPGHIFPIVARDGGVLTRAGHTEAGCDLARLAGCTPEAVIVEILNEDGTMARRDDLEIFAQKHNLKMGTIADLIEYRIKHETTIEILASQPFHTEYGHFTITPFKDTIAGQIHYALQKGPIHPAEITLVRVHSHNFFCDSLGAHMSEKKSWTLRDSLKKIAQEKGVVVILQPPQKPETQLAQLHLYNAHHAPQPDRTREVGLGSQILKALGIRKMQLLNTPAHYRSLSGFGLEIVGFITDNQEISA